MASHIKNLLKQLSFYGKTIKPRIKESTNAKLVIICDYYFIFVVIYENHFYL